LVYVDDATSKIMELLFVKSESTFSYFEATRRYIDKHGKSLALYSDKAGIFRVNNKNATGGDGHTQFGRAMHELNIQTICADTREAKGRVERAHLPLQDRLAKVLRLQGISSMEAANAFAERYRADYNRRFGKMPRHDFDVDRTVALPCSIYDRLSEIDQGAIVDNKRLGRTLEFIRLVQSKRDDTCSQSVPACDGPSRRRPRAAVKKTLRALNQDDMPEDLKPLQSRSKQIFGKKPG